MKKKTTSIFFFRFIRFFSFLSSKFLHSTLKDHSQIPTNSEMIRKMLFLCKVDICSDNIIRWNYLILKDSSAVHVIWKNKTVYTTSKYKRKTSKRKISILKTFCFNFLDNFFIYKKCRETSLKNHIKNLFKLEIFFEKSPLYFTFFFPSQLQKIRRFDATDFGWSFIHVIILNFSIFNVTELWQN